MQSTKIYLLQTQSFDKTEVEKHLHKNSPNLGFDKGSRVYLEKLFSQFIRHFVFQDILKISPLEFCYDENGKPYINGQDVCFNISHTNGVVVLAVSSQDVGVDVEKIYPRKRMLAIAERFFSSDEYYTLERSHNLAKDFFTLWTLKESQVKKSGLGIAKGLHLATFYKNSQELWSSDNNQEKFHTIYINDFVISICSNLDDLSFYEIKSNFHIQKIKQGRK